MENNKEESPFLRLLSEKGITYPLKEKVVIIADIHEKSQIPNLLKKNDNVELILAPLEVGDYWVSPDMAIELKRGTDFGGSVMGTIDHNIFSQMARMSEQFPYPNLIVQEYKINFFMLKNKIKSFVGALDSLKRKYPVHQTESDEETVKLLIRFAEKEQKSHSHFARRNPAKASIMDKKEYFIQGLPMVGSKLSAAIVDAYRSDSLLKFFNDVLNAKFVLTKTGKVKGFKAHPNLMKIKKLGYKKIMAWKEIIGEMNDDSL